MNGKFRHEKKYEIDRMIYLSLKPKLLALTSRDPMVREDGKYIVTSLYFDNCYDKALNEKLQSVNKREKFRIRYYNHDMSFIKLEKKQKINGLCLKTSCLILKEEVERLQNNDWEFLLDSDRPLLQELGFKMRTQMLRIRSVVEYTREPYIYAPGNTRITFDFVKGDFIVLEVKYDEFLPGNIAAIIQPYLSRQRAISKYAESRKIYF